MERSDVVSIHAPETVQTRHMIGADLLSRLADGAVLINTARGGIIDEAALIDELSTGRIFAFLDCDRPRAPGAGQPAAGASRTWWSPPTSPVASTTATGWGSWPSRRSAATWAASRPSTRSGPTCSTGSPSRVLKLSS